MIYGQLIKMCFVTKWVDFVRQIVGICVINIF
jgi:hypothetical protein